MKSGDIIISRVHGEVDYEDYVMIEVRDRITNRKVVVVNIGLREWDDVLTGKSGVPCSVKVNTPRPRGQINNVLKWASSLLYTTFDLAHDDPTDQLGVSREAVEKLREAVLAAKPCTAGGTADSTTDCAKGGE